MSIDKIIFNYIQLTDVAYVVSNCERSVMRVGLVKDSCEKYITCWWIGLLEVQCIFNIRMWCEEKDGRVPMRYYI